MIIILRKIIIVTKYTVWERQTKAMAIKQYDNFVSDH